MMVLLLALPGCGEELETAGRVLGIAAEGGVKQLREPVREPAGPPRVLIFALDGVGQDALDDAMDAGALPTLKALLGHRTGPPPSPTA